MNGQIIEIKKFCKQHGHNIIRIYTDEAKSGKTANRPQFQNMIQQSEEHKFQAVVVYQLDRFARNRYDSVLYKAKLQKNGVRVLSARENISEDASGVMVEGMLETMAEYFSIELAQKVNRRNETKCSKGLL